jgi:2-amino-4-hydroxy-6-hydroxymethyldihydropteridine diphosphokinase
MVTVYLLLGGNQGDRSAYLRSAAEAINLRVGKIIERSGIYETQSWGKTDEPDHLNQVLMVTTDLNAQDVLQEILLIELSLGRQRIEKWGGRTIDIDILFYSDQVISEPQLIVPHPELHNRRFTLEPLAEIAPELIHPVLKKSVGTLKSELTDKLQVKKIYF